MKILLVDDTKTDQLIMKAYLQDLGHDVVAGSNGIEACEVYKSDKPDLILMDVIMPEMDGLEAAREIRKDTSDWIPIIFLSARVSSEDITEGINAGGDDYLTKPVDQQVLVAKLKAMERIAKMRQKLLKVSSELEFANEELKLLVNVDGLTGLANRRNLDRVLKQDMSRSMRNKQPLTVILADIDHFKSFNDNYGHLEGDECLKKVSKALSKVCKRGTDLVARYGGEEFAVLLPDTKPENAMIVAEKLRAAVESLKVIHEHSTASGYCTVSIGVHTKLVEKSDTPESLLQKADAGLYRSKESGRNKISYAE
jgi:diguanylate cyclase (GGDEF)-like protein